MRGEGTEPSPRLDSPASPGAGKRPARPRCLRRSGAEEGAVPELCRAVVDLVDVDVLGLGVLEDAFHAELAADAALLVAAERRRDRQQVVVVDPDGARPHLLR